MARESAFAFRNPNTSAPTKTGPRGRSLTMALYRRGKTLWYVFEFGGRKIQESSGFRNKTAAMRAEAKRKTDLMERRAGFTKPKPIPKFDDFCEQFLESSKQQHRPKTYDLHAWNIKTLKR